MSTQVDKDRPTLSRTQRFMRFPLTRMVIAIFITALAGGLTLTYASTLAHRWGQVMWPEFLGAAAILLAYWLYVCVFERRTPTELAGTKALPELGAGLLMGSVLVTVVIVLRITEQALGSWAALVISSLLFGLAHLPGQGAGVLTIVITVDAGVLFASAYLLTRRLWLGIGIHIAWNYTLGSIYSIAVSGHEAKGLLQGTVTGPDWLTGGAYGLEGSVFTLIVLATMAAYLLRSAWVKGHIYPAPWRR
jgi:hypothetical protein